MIERWVLYYDGACPFCTRANDKVRKMLPNIKLTSVDLNSEIATSKGYKDSVVLETPSKIYKGYHAWLKIIEQTKYRWFASIFKKNPD